ncbi:GAF domain-containing protein [Microlunatus antarcticus]|uniref:GAF domain-containing protein n=1 Tax=Microlunatus antarcticus TaxID=53388 RepID=A0A7W5P7W8_9ACTN|nr:hypothetical protein [Microlunatus antarcticus]
MATTPLIDAPTRTTYAHGRARPSARDELDAHLRLQHRVDLLPSLVDGCHHASVTTVTGGRLTVRVSTDRTARRADELQDALGEGPCLQSVRTGHSVVAADLRTETRWTRWCAEAVSDLGLTGALSVLLVSNLRPLATLNLYSDTVGGLAELDLAHLHTLTAPLSSVLLRRLAR